MTNAPDEIKQSFPTFISSLIVLFIPIKQFSPISQLPAMTACDHMKQ